MDKRLLTILRCPASNKGLALAKRDLLDSVNAAIKEGTLKNRDGSKVEAALAEALVTDDGKLLYPVDDGIPVLLEGESVALEQLHLYD
jgi:uncharacterized protein YbaR (Trm112 family)